jgi:hypothetical protein
MSDTIEDYEWQAFGAVLAIANLLIAAGEYRETVR